MTLFEYYDVTPNNANAIYSSIRYAQTFTVGESAHTISSVQLLIYKVGTVGTVTVEVKAVDGSGKPTGSVLASNTFDGTTLTTDTDGEWKEITWAQYNLSASTMYALEVSMSGGSVNNWVVWRNEYNPGNYSDGKGWYSDNGGSTWTDYNLDFMFKVYGAYTVTISETLGLSDSISRSANFKQALTEKLGLSDGVTRRASFKQLICEFLGLADTTSISEPPEHLGIIEQVITKFEKYTGIKTVFATGTAEPGLDNYAAPLRESTKKMEKYSGLDNNQNPLRKIINKLEKQS
jgi:hypothetical protein